LAWRIVHNYGFVIANAQTASNASKIFRACHVPIGRPRDTAKPAQVYRIGNVTRSVLLRWARVDDADIGVVHSFGEPICFSEVLGICVASLIYRDHRHDFPPLFEALSCSILRHAVFECRLFSSGEAN
jgi:hypothetical protein